MTKRKIIILGYCLLIILTIKLLFSFIINSNLIKSYNNGEYSEKYAKVLKISNFFESYIAYYNYGNILYQNGKYDDAISEYEKALKRFVPRLKECSIRINYALSICKTVQVDEKNVESIKEAINKYEKAIDILTEEGCANKENNNGHNKKAEKLKEDIQKEIDRLKNLLNEENKKESKEEKEDKEEKEIQVEENKIQNIKEEAIKRQRELEATYNNYNKDYKVNEKNW